MFRRRRRDESRPRTEAGERELTSQELLVFVILNSVWEELEATTGFPADEAWEVFREHVDVLALVRTCAESIPDELWQRFNAGDPDASRECTEVVTAAMKKYGGDRAMQQIAARG
jgi:hypothetical protein